MKRTRLIFVPTENAAAPTLLAISEEGTVLERRGLEFNEPRWGGRTLLVVPGADVAAFWLHLPTRNPVQARAAAAHLLEERLAAPPQDAHLALGPLDASGKRLVGVVSRAKMEAWLALARLYGIAPDAAVPDHLLLPAPEHGEVIVARTAAGVAVRSADSSFSCEPELLETVVGAGPVKVLEGEALDRLFAQGALATRLNLLQGEFDLGKRDAAPRRQLRRIATLAAVLALAPAAVLAVEIGRYVEGLRSAYLAGEREVNAVMPKGRPLGDALVQAQSQIARLELAAGRGPMGSAATLFAALESMEGSQLEILIASSDGLRAAISHTNHSDVEVLREALQRAGFTCELQSTHEEAGRVKSELLVRRRL